MDTDNTGTGTSNTVATATGPVQNLSAREAMLLECTTKIVCIGSGRIATNEIPALIAQVYTALNGAVSGSALRPVQPVSDEKLVPAVKIKDSVQPDFIVCLEDGKRFKSLKRHLMTHYSLTPEQYREKWGLPHTYPMVAASYAEKRSQLAKDMGLGRKR